MKKLKKLIPLGVSLLPVMAFAATENLKDLIGVFAGILDMVVGLLVAVAVAYVIWGAAQLAMGGGDPEKRKEARDKIIYGVIGVVVMVSIYGVISLVANTFDVAPGDAGNIDIPTVSDI